MFYSCSLLLSGTAAGPVSKMEMTVVVRNPEIVFVADLTRADAPALVMTTYCEVSMISGAESTMTASIKDLKVYIFPMNLFIFGLQINNFSIYVCSGCGMSLLKRD